MATGGGAVGACSVLAQFTHRQCSSRITIGETVGKVKAPAHEAEVIAPFRGGVVMDMRTSMSVPWAGLSRAPTTGRGSPEGSGRRAEKRRPAHRDDLAASEGGLCTGLDVIPGTPSERGIDFLLSRHGWVARLRPPVSTSGARATRFPLRYSAPILVRRT